MTSDLYDEAGARASAQEIFGSRAGLATTFAQMLATDGVTRGLIGPREAPILWDRHILNCAALADHLPQAGRVVDVGSGAGLPGVVLAIRRPELRVDLVEPLLRRSSFLAEVIERLGLAEQVRVVRGRAEDRSVVSLVGSADWVTARAVAPLGRLVRWCLPLLSDGGTLLAVKGGRAAQEVASDGVEIRSAGGTVVDVTPLAALEQGSQVVRVVRTSSVTAISTGSRR